MKTNTKTRQESVTTHEGGKAQRVSPYEELRRSVITCLLWEDTFYESGSEIGKRIADLIKSVLAEKVAALAIEARNDMQLRHVPLFLIRELARIKGNGALVANTLAEIIQRVDELSEFVAMYWKEGRQPLSAGVKRGLARAFIKFNAYQLAKYNRDETVKLRDVLFLSHAKPKDKEQETTWKALINGTLEAPDTWEVALSAGKDKKATFERLLAEGKLGGLAVLRNLRNMIESGVNESMIKNRLGDGIKRALPFRFVTAARYAPQFESEIEAAMMLGLSEMENLGGKTGLLIDVSGSMDQQLSARGETTRMDAASGLAILLREICQSGQIATFSNKLVIIPTRHGFALRDAITQSQEHSATYLAGALQRLSEVWKEVDRLIVITDEQSQDDIYPAWTKKTYLINVASYEHGVGYGNGFVHINGWSEKIIDYIQALEKENHE